MSIFDMKFFRFLGFKKRPSSPWSKYYDKKDMEIKIPDMSLYEFYEKNSSRYKDRFAMDYYGTKITYESLSTKIEECAKAFASYGIRKGDVVTICMPNTPEGIISFLALNKLGAVSNMMHPLASENEIKDTLIETGSVMLVLIDIAYSKVKKIIDETNKPYVNELIDKFNKKYNTIIPYYENGVGLSIGAMTSQFFAIYYLNNLDHYIKEQLHCKYYVRYMDDFIIFDLDKERLKFVWKEIEDQLKKIKLTINPKSNIFRLSIGITFLGYKYRIYNHKLKITYRKKTIKKIKKRLEKYKALDKLKYYRIYGSYYGYLKKVKICERNFTMKAIEKYEYYKEKKPNYLVFIKEGSFYKTFGDDAVIIWHLFKYKWNNHAIAFGASTCSKVLDSLNRLGLSYCMVSDTDLDVTNDESVYDLYKELAIKNYSKFKKKEELAKMLEELLDSNINLYDSLLNYFKELKGANRDEAKNED